MGNGKYDVVFFGVSYLADFIYIEMDPKRSKKDSPNLD